MYLIKSLSELKIPNKHKKFINQYIANISRFDCIDRVILFGSCAKGTATENSDVDLFVITSEDISEDLEYEIIFDSVPTLHEGYVPNDILLKSSTIYSELPTSLKA